MSDLNKVVNPYNDDKVISNCSIFGMMDVTGRRFSGEDVLTAIANMRVRGNGLGGGFACYGLYPKYPDHYALHLMYISKDAKEKTELFIDQNFFISRAEEIPTQHIETITNPPLFWRYFVKPKTEIDKSHHDDFVVEKVMQINTSIKDTFVFSSGKNMGVFKGVGFPEDIGRFFMIEDYKGYIWTAHGRFPTNTPGWWGGAHPFNILDWSVVHNGEISSYGINQRFLEMYGYKCTLFTDTEVIAYAVDLLMRKHELPIEIASKVLAPPLWTMIEYMKPEEKRLYTTLRQVYGSLLLNGPFSVVIARQGEMIGLTDRIRLRPLTAATSGNMLFLSSEEAAIRLISPDLDRAWIPKGGEPIVGRLETKSVIYDDELTWTELKRRMNS